MIELQSSWLQEQIEKVYDIFDTSFIYKENELILHKKWNIYFRVDDIYDNYDFSYKLLSYCSFYCASNHFKKTPKNANIFGIDLIDGLKKILPMMSYNLYIQRLEVEQIEV